MGNHESTPQPPSEDTPSPQPTGAYGKMVGDMVRRGGYPPVETLGGSTHHPHHSLNTNDLSTLKDYEKSYASKAKEETIRKMARAMKKVGMNVNPDDDLDKIIDDLNREIPNPKKGKTFAAESKSQEKVCKIVANVLNDEFTPGAPDHEKFIDLSLSPIEICRAVGEYTHSFSQGVNTEFLGVIGSVQNALRSMNIMDQVMHELYEKIQNNIGKADSNILEREIKPLNDVYIRAKHERDQKKMVLENLLHVHLEPASKALNDALREHGNDVSLIKKLGLKLGTADFANAIAAALSGLGSTASIANHVNKALKTVGVSMNEYLNSHTFKEFQQKLDSIVDEGKLSDKDLIKFLNATNVLREGFDYRTDKKFKDIIARGGRGVMGGAKDGGRRVNYDLGDNIDYESMDGMAGMSHYRKKASSIMAKKQLISKDFVIRLDRHYTELLEAIKDIAINLGKTIPLTSKTELLKDSLTHLNDENMSSGDGTGNLSEEMTIEFIVSRGIDTIEARRRKEMYINKIKMIADVCDIITGMEAYRATSSKFAKVKDVVSKIEKMIEYYSNITNNSKNAMSSVGVYDHDYAKSISSPSPSSSSSYESKNKNDSDEDEDVTATGGASEFEYKEIDVPQIAKTGLTLNEIINTFNYYYYIAGVRNNLKISSKEYNLYGEDYSNMLGNSIAKRLYDLDVKYKKDIRIINETLKGDGWLSNDGINNDGNKNEKIRDEAKKWVDSEYNIKVKFYKALQALDLYLKEFTPAITSNIEAVKEMKSMLDETQVIARWFNENTGNELCDAFEALPGYNVKDHIGTPAQFDDRINSTRHPITSSNADTHYYDSINSMYLDGRTFAPAVGGSQNGVTFGNPLYGISIIPGDENIKKIDKMKKSVHSSVDHFQALKNIVNTFIRIGNKFGQTDLSTKVFMSPSQIYRILFNFLKESSLRMHIPNDTTIEDHVMLFTENSIDVQKQNLQQLGGAANPEIPNAKISGGKLTGQGSLVRINNISNNTIAPFSVYFTGRANGIMDNNTTRSNNNYEVENKFFHAMIKAMAGKIMTVVGSYDMLEMTPPKHWITDTRMILGGSKSKNVKRGGGIEGIISSEDQLEIIGAAMPLYFKLPRLIEFYKEILDPTGVLSSNSGIAFLPDLDGLFTPLFLLIFRKTRTPENGEYSDMELHKMVEEINNIYHYYSKNKSDDIITAVINDIVLDVNRKYGLLKKDDYNTWLEMTKNQSDSMSGSLKINTTNYSILPDEDEYEVNKFAPSDAYKGLSRTGEFKYDNSSGKYINEISGVERSVFSNDTVDIVDSFGENPHVSLIKKFREKLDTYFKDSNIKNMSSYTILVHQAEDTVRNAKTNKEKISTVFQLIQGTGNLGLKNDKAILFHETIITGLNVLSGIYLMLERYHNNIKDSDPLVLEQKLTNILYGLLCLATKDNNNQLRLNRFLGLNTKKYSLDINAAAAPAIAPGVLPLQNTTYHCDTNNMQQVLYTPIDPTDNIYFYSKRLNSILFENWDNNKNYINDDSRKFLIDGSMIDEPILRGTKILPYFTSDGTNLLNKSDYANDENNIYPVQKVEWAVANGGEPRNITTALIPANPINDWYNPMYGNGNRVFLAANEEFKQNMYLNSHPTYRILTTIITTKLDTGNGPHNRLFKVGNGPNDYVLPSDIIDYNNFKDNDGIISQSELQSKFGNNARLSISDRQGIAVGEVSELDKKNLLFMRLISRVGVNHQHIMENLLENMYSLIVDSNGLIDLTYFKVENNKTKLNLNFTKLQNVVNGIITDLKFYLEYFRPFLKKSVIDHYENITIGGSIYNLEKKFYNLFNPNTDMYNDAQQNIFNIEVLSKTTNDIFSNLTRDTHVSFSALKMLLPGPNMYRVPNYNNIGTAPVAAIGNAFNVVTDRSNTYNTNIIMVQDADTNNVAANVMAPNQCIFNLLWTNANIDIRLPNNNDPGYNTRFEWFGGTMSNLIYYDFSKKLPYNKKAGTMTINTPSFTNESELIKIDDYTEALNYREAKYATREYFYPHGHYKLRELLGENKEENTLARDLYVQNAAVGFKYAADIAAANVRPIPNCKTQYRYTAISMFGEIRSDNNRQINNFNFDEYLQISAQRATISLCNSQNSEFRSFCYNHPTIEDLDTYSYPVQPSSSTKNTGYNMGICVKDPKRPSKDVEYKLSSLISKSQKSDNYKSIYSHLIQWPNSRNNETDFREYSRAALYSRDCVAFNHNSLMFIFNQILSRFLSAFIDPSTGNKIYRNLVNGFVNGVATKVSSQPESGFPDLYRTATHHLASQNIVAGHNIQNGNNENPHSMIFQKVLGLRGDVKNDSIIFQSLAYILQRIGKDMERNTGSPLHMLSTLTDVPMYMKESYRANLPSFIKIFDYIIQKAEFFKNIIQKTEIKLNRYSQCDFANFINSCTGLTDVRVNEVRYELHSYFVPAKYLQGLMPNSIQPLQNTYNGMTYDNYINRQFNKFKEYYNGLIYRSNQYTIAVAAGLPNVIGALVFGAGATSPHDYFRAAIINGADCSIQVGMTPINIDAANLRLGIIRNNLLPNAISTQAEYNIIKEMCNNNINSLKSLMKGTIKKLIMIGLVRAFRSFPAAILSQAGAPLVPAAGITIDELENIKILFNKYFIDVVMEKSILAPAGPSINQRIDEAINASWGTSAFASITALLTEIATYLNSNFGNNRQSLFCTSYNDFIVHYYDEAAAAAPCITEIVAANTVGGALQSWNTINIADLGRVKSRFAAEYEDLEISYGEKLLRTHHRLYNNSQHWHILPFSKELDAIHPNRIRSADNVKISCTRGTRGYNLPLLKNNGTPIFADEITYNYEFLKISDKNAKNVNGYISVEGLNEFTVKNENSDTVKTKFISILDSIISNAYSISGCADEVLKELGDTPVYFETYEGSIENYQLRNNNDQLMPLSLALWFMNDNYALDQSVNIGPSHVLFSGHNLGSSDFKLLYGTRQLLAKNMALTYEEVPWVKTLLNRHNSSASDKPVEESRYLQFVNRLINGLRFVVNSHGYKRIVAYNSYGVADNGEQPAFGKYDGNIWNVNKSNNNGTQFVRRGVAQVTDRTPALFYGETVKYKNTVYALSNGKFNKDFIIQLLEDSFQENSVSKILQAFYIDDNKLSGISRKDERIKVIIDSSINPINVHALMQDIPLANIYNYEYTFETMAASMYGVLMKNISDSDNINADKHPLKQTIFEFLRLLRNPFANVNPAAFHIGFNYEEPLFNIFIGDGSLGMGRPKFLSDQLFNKCLLNNVYYDNSRPKTRGPAPKAADDSLGKVSVDRGVNMDYMGAGSDGSTRYYSDIVAGNAISQLMISQAFAELALEIYNDSLAYKNLSVAAPTDPTRYPTKSASDRLFRFLMNAENIDKTAKSPAELNMGTAPGGVLNAQIYCCNFDGGAHPRDHMVGNNRITRRFTILETPELASRYRELYKKTSYYNKFKTMANTSAIKRQCIYLISRNTKFIKFANLEENFNKVIDGLFEIAFLAATVRGDTIAHFQTIDIGLAGVTKMWNGYMTVPSNIGLIFVAQNAAAVTLWPNAQNNFLVTYFLRFGLFNNFIPYAPGVAAPNAGPPTFETALMRKANEFNSRYVTQIDPANDTELIMSYLKNYTYNDNKFDGYNTSNNPLVKYEYLAAGAVQSTAGTPTLAETIRNISHLRFNTNLIRNLFFISNILRIIRLQINREFTQNRNILKSSHFAISPSVTEYGLMDPNEIFTSKYRDAGTFNDSIEGDMDEVE